MTEVSVYRRGTVWAVQFYLPDGTRKRISTRLPYATTPEADALRRGQDIAAQHLGGTYVPTEAGKLAPMLKTLLGDHWERHWSKRKGASVMRYMIPAIQADAIAYLPATKVTTKVLREYAQRLTSDGLAPATINRRLTAISTVLKRYAEDEELQAPRVPFLEENNLRERYLTHDEERAVFEFLDRTISERAIGDRPRWRWMRALVVVLIDTGMRLGEATGWDHQRKEAVGLTKFNLRYQPGEPLPSAVWLPHGSTKNGRGRTIPLTRRAAEAILYLIEQRPEGVNLDQNWCIRRWATARESVPGLADVNLHILRHTCASRLVMAGVDLLQVKEWLGHRDLNSTLRYAHLAPDALSGALAKLQAQQDSVAQANRHTRHATIP